MVAIKYVVSIKRWYVAGLVWSIILHWQVHYHLKELMSELQQTNLEKTLLAWCRTHTANYSGVSVRNFTSSWSDGLAFNALLHRWRPQLFDYTTIVGRSPTARLEHAFNIAHTHLGIDKLLDPEGQFGHFGRRLYQVYCQSLITIVWQIDAIFCLLWTIVWNGSNLF